jgi:hypothetical protein
MFFSLVALTNASTCWTRSARSTGGSWTRGTTGTLRSVVRVYDVGPSLTKALLAGAFAVELVAAALFWRALLRLGRRERELRDAFTAVCFGTAVWIGFVFMTEFFTAYDSESVFRELLALMIGSALALVLVLVPDDAAGGFRSLIAAALLYAGLVACAVGDRKPSTGWEPVAGLPLAEPQELRAEGGVLAVDLSAERRIVNVSGSPPEARPFNGALPGPTPRVSPGDRLEVKLSNHLGEPTNVRGVATPANVNCAGWGGGSAARAWRRPAPAVRAGADL